MADLSARCAIFASEYHSRRACARFSGADCSLLAISVYTGISCIRRHVAGTPRHALSLYMGMPCSRVCNAGVICMALYGSAIIAGSCLCQNVGLLGPSRRAGLYEVRA